jgi:hypothetical protein
VSSTSYTALGGSRLAGRDDTIYWTEADPSANGLHQIVAASLRGKTPVVQGIPLPPARMRGMVATSSHLVWHDGAMLRLARLDTGAVTHVDDHSAPGLAWLTCLTADRVSAYYARASDGGSALGRVDADGTTHELAVLAGTVDQLVVAGEHLAWTLHGASDVYVQRVGGTPELLFSAKEPFALCAAGADHLVLAVGTSLLRLGLATGELVTLAAELAAGWPYAVAWHAGVAYIARHEIAVAGTRLGSCLERVDLANDTATIVHAPTAERTIDHLAANDHGAFCLERLRAGADLGVAITSPALPGEVAPPHGGAVSIVHVTPTPVARTVIEQRGTRTGGGIRIDASVGRLRAGFVGEVTSCAELVKRIATDAPHRLELLFAPASPGELWSSACIGRALPSVTSFIVPNSGSLGQLVDVFTAMPALERAFVVGELKLEPFEHETLRELHLESEILPLTFAKSFASCHFAALERCALTFKRISTASLLKLVEALAMVNAPTLRTVHFGGLRGPDQIRDVTSYLSERRAPFGWELVSFNGALGGEEQWLDVVESIKPPGTLRVALPLVDMLGAELAKAQQRRHRWLVDVGDTGWAPGDARAAASWI